MSRLDDIYTEMDAHTAALTALTAEARTLSGTDGGDGGGPVTVTTGPELAAALLAGGAITAAPGLYVGNFVVSQPTHLQLDDGAILRPRDRREPVLRVRANDVEIVGGTIQNGEPDREVLVVGDLEATDAAAQPHHVVLRLLTIEAGPAGGHRAVALHGVDLTVEDCEILGFFEIGRESQGVWILNGPGPYTIRRNYIEASGECIMVGGSTVHIPDCIPSDILITENLCVKPAAWETLQPSPVIKNAIELKLGRRVEITHNTCDGNWDAGQDGSVILVTVRNQDGDCPWAAIDDVTIVGNTTKRCPKGFAVNVLGQDDRGAAYPSAQLRTLTIAHNLFTDSPNGVRIINGVADALTIENNTWPVVAGNFLQFGDTRATIVRSPLTFADNVTPQGAYGVSADGVAPGTPTLDQFCTIVTFTGNYLETHPDRVVPLPGDNTWFDDLPIDPVTFKVTDGSGKGY